MRLDERTIMKILLYFDWSGSRKEVAEHYVKMQEACNETGVQYLGTYGAMNQKWNYVYIFEARSYDHFREMASKVPRPPQMTHYITDILLPINIERWLNNQ